MLMAAAALLEKKPKPTDADIDEAITNICRCGTYQRVRAADQAGGRGEGVRRRTWLLGTTVGTGALLVGWGLMPQRSRLGLGSLMQPGEGDMALNGWIKVLPDGAVVLAMPRSEMGQGVHTALPMLAAEELDVPLSAMRIEQAGADAIYGNVAMLVSSLPFHPMKRSREDGFGRVKAGRWLVGKVARELGINATGGSSSVADAWEVVRMAAATARASLIGAASLQWKLPAEDLTVKNGIVSHPSACLRRTANSRGWLRPPRPAKSS
jgi:isoquinoline 1-oxidoreductase beta subunit